MIGIEGDESMLKNSLVLQAVNETANSFINLQHRIPDFIALGPMTVTGMIGRAINGSGEPNLFVFEKAEKGVGSFLRIVIAGRQVNISASAIKHEMIHRGRFPSGLM